MKIADNQKQAAPSVLMGGATVCSNTTQFDWPIIHVPSRREGGVGKKMGKREQARLDQISVKERT